MSHRHPAPAARRPLRRPLLAALAAALALVSPLGAQARPGAVEFTGRVVDASTGAPVSRAIVTLKGGHGSAVTDAGGRFVMARVPAGPYLAAVERLGYARLASAVTVAAGEGAELRMEPDPLVLEGLAVNGDRLASRRRATALSVRTLEADELVRSPFANVAELVTGRVVDRVRCDDGSRNCTQRRGRAQWVAVYVDEVRAFGGLEQLSAYDPQDVFLIEAYGRGEQVRVYTNQYMERLAVSGAAPDPVFLP